MIPNIYEGNYKRLVIFPLILILTSIFFIPQIKQGVDFKGGVLITLHTSAPVNISIAESTLQSELKTAVSIKQIETAIGNSIEISFPLDENISRAEKIKEEFFSLVDDASRLEADASVLESDPNSTSTGSSPDAKEKYTEARERLNLYADELFLLAGLNKQAAKANSTNELRRMVSDAYNSINSDYQTKIRSTIEKHIPYSSISFELVSSTLSERFLSSALWVILVSSALSIAVVFFVFRTFIPSIAVLIGAASDIIIALGAMGLFGIPLTLASFAALLMLIGFSLDTDILLTMRTLKRSEGRARDRAFESMKTGSTMSMAAITAFASLLILSLATNISTYYEISSVALAGLFGDLFATWGLNAVIILWYAEKKEKEAEAIKTHFASLYERKE
ncbi:MAG: hypothetical protein QXN01_02235 [Candidatus Anstonellales archaeon]